MVDYKGPPPPKGTWRRAFWERKIRFETGFGLALIDRTEKYVILGVCLLATLIFWWSVYNYLPSHIAYLARRLSYYIHGDENAAIFGPVLAGWWGVVRRELGLVGRLYKGVWDNRFGWENTIENGNAKVDL